MILTLGSERHQVNIHNISMQRLIRLDILPLVVSQEGPCLALVTVGGEPGLWWSLGGGRGRSGLIPYIYLLSLAPPLILDQRPKILSRNMSSVNTIPYFTLYLLQEVQKVISFDCMSLKPSRYLIRHYKQTRQKHE
eukprot:Gb_39108 [translate_table: standard]